MARITPDDMARFHRNAPAALGRCSGGFVAEQLAEALELLATGLVPIIGMLAFGWSANQLLLFLLVGVWVAILLDITKYIVLGPQVERFGAARYDDWHVWVVVETLRAGRNEAPTSHLKTRYEPAAGVLIDLTCGVMATGLICLALRESGAHILQETWRDHGVRYCLAALVGLQIVRAAWEIVRHKTVAKDGEVKVALGLRGLGLFFLMGAVIMVRESVGENGAIARGVMLAVNGGIVALAVMNSVGLLWVRGDAAWLREYLQKRSGK